ncbi:unnamed protein product [Calypogeia fissa]
MGGGGGEERPKQLGASLNCVVERAKRSTVGACSVGETRKRGSKARQKRSSSTDLQGHVAAASGGLKAGSLGARIEAGAGSQQSGWYATAGVAVLPC